jgi:hypothetical protein
LFIEGEKGCFNAPSLMTDRHHPRPLWIKNAYIQLTIQLLYHALRQYRPRGLIYLSGLTLRIGAIHRLDPNDTIVVFDPTHPPATPPANTLVKWGKTTRVSWNTSGYKCYYYNTLPFRLKFPRGYTAAADGKTYPLFIFFHDVGEAGAVSDNELQLSRGGQLHNDAVDIGLFDGFLLYPQSPGAWGAAQFATIVTLIRQYFVPQIKVDTTCIIVSGLSVCGEHPPVLGIPIWLFQGGLDKSPDPSTTEQIVEY